MSIPVNRQGILDHLHLKHLLLAAVVAVPAYFLVYTIYAVFLSPQRDIPGPFLARVTRLWELAQVCGGKSHEKFIKLHEKYGRVVRVSPNTYSFNSPEDVKKIYSISSGFTKTHYYDAVGNPGRSNLFGMRDEVEHAKRRKALNNLYSMSTMVNYEDAVDRTNALLLRKLNEYSRRGQKIMVPEVIQCYAFDVIGQITYEEDFGFLENEGDVDNMIDLVYKALIYFGRVGLFPEFHVPLFKIMQALGIKNAGIVIDPAVSKALDKYRKIGFAEKANPKSDCFTAKLLRLEKEGKVEFIEQVDCIVSNLTAGSDTTGITISACLYYLYNNPPVLKKLRDEIEQATQQGKASDPITFQEAQNLGYLQCVIAETLRIHPGVGYILPREVPAGGMELGGTFFPAGTQVGASAWALNRNPEVYGADADVFKPERYIDQFGAVKNAAAQMGNSFSFGGGSRTCIGKNVSLLEMTKVVPQIVRNFDLEFADNKPWTTYSTWFVWPKYHCYIKPREK